MDTNINYNLKIYDDLLEDLRNIYIDKNNDYGNSVGENFNKYGNISFLVRLNDKMNRLNTLTENKESKIKDESLEDTIKDLANYCLLWLIELNKKEKIKEDNNKIDNKDNKDLMKSFVKNLWNKNEDIYNLSGIKRYNTLHTIHDENVAEHSYYVIWFALKICDILNIDNDTKLKILEMCIVHDIPEIYVSDVNAYIKNKSEKLSSTLEDLEIKMMYKHFPTMYEYFENYCICKNNNSLEYLIVKLADLMSVDLFIQVEESLGNDSTLSKIDDRVTIEMLDIIKKIFS